MAPKRARELPKSVKKMFAATVDDGILMKYNFEGKKGKGSISNSKIYEEIKSKYSIIFFTNLFIRLTFS